MSFEETHIVACGWYDLLGKVAPPEVAKGDLQADRVVIGGGFTGLSCARRLAELFPQDSIILLESDRIGRSNSGRNSGFLLNASFYDDAPARIVTARTNLQTAGLAEIKRIVDSHQIACDWTPWGNLYGAGTEIELAHLESLRGLYLKAGAEIEDWDGARMAATTGTDHFKRGVFYPGTVLVQPAALVRGLAATMPTNVQVFESSAVTGLVQKKDAHLVATQEARITAGTVYVCANGGAPALGIGRARLIPVSTFAAFTPPLGPSDGTLAGAKPFGMLSYYKGGATLRFLPDGRLLVRQGTAYTPKGAGPEVFPDILKRCAHTARFYWPDLNDVGFDYAWSGLMSITRNTGQIFGEIKKNLYAAVFCNGAHNTGGTSAGKLLAELSAGEESSLLHDQLALPRPKWVPAGPVLKYLAKRRMRLYNEEVDRVYGKI